jgi:DNA (cytosine-5)-methyltransferase 1
MRNGRKSDRETPVRGGVTLPIKVFDFFSGCGGSSVGFQNAGMEIVFAIDSDGDAATTYKSWFPQAKFFTKDVEAVATEAISHLLDACNGHPVLFCGCAPCQPFTKQNTQKSSNGKQLLKEFSRFVTYYRPDLVFVENVPGMQRVQGNEGPFLDFLRDLRKSGYQYRYDIVSCQDYGVPQKRCRLILIASRFGPIQFPEKTHGPRFIHPEYSTVREWIGDLPPIQAGEVHDKIPNHRAASLSLKNVERIKATPEGGSRKDWPPHLRLDCHSVYTGHSDVYGRMAWDKPATGLTTRCISLSNGRFGHPKQDRAISVREAACLQTFPRNFEFSGSLSSMARQIGNALPVKVAECFGRNFVDHVNKSLEVAGNGKI